MNILIKTLMYLITIAISVVLMLSIGFSDEVKSPIINEVMSSNTSTVKDEDNDYSDWIELYNPLDSHVNLIGYGLSDRPENPYKWVFQDCILNPGEYKLIFTSGKNRKLIGKHWENVITRGDEWKYFLYEVPNSEKWMYINVVEKKWVPGDWVKLEFDDSGWESGLSGFGYGDDDDETVVSENTGSIFMRKSFYIEDVENITNCFLHVDYDNDFIAYLNGHYIAVSNSPYSIVVDLEEYDDPQPDDLKLSWADQNNHDTYFLGMHLAGVASYKSGWVEVPDVVDSIARLDKRVYSQLVGILGALDSSNRRQQLRDCIKIYLLTHLS